MSKIILYSTNCPMCKMIEEKFNKENVDYEICNNIEEMKKQGISNVPMAYIDGKLINVKKILKWLEEKQNG